MNHPETSLLAEIVDSFGQCLTPEVAGRIISLRASERLRERLEVLADRCTEGQLTDEERGEYETYVQFLSFLSILQAKARKIATPMIPA